MKRKVQHLIDILETKVNLWYLDNGNLSDDYGTVLKDLKKTVEAEKTFGLKIKPSKCKFFFLGDITEKRRLKILASFQKLCPGIKTPKKDETYHSWFTARPEITSRLIGKENK